MNLAQMDVQQLTQIVTQAVNFATVPLHEKIDGLVEENKDLKIQLVGLREENKDLKIQLVGVQGRLELAEVRLDTIDDKLATLEKAFAGAAPFFIKMLEAQNSLLLECDNWKELRDEAPVNQFCSAWDYFKDHPVFSSIAKYIERVSQKSAAIISGKVSTQFYTSIQSYKPRKISGKSQYHTEELIFLDFAANVLADHLEVKLAN